MINHLGFTFYPCGNSAYPCLSAASASGVDLRPVYAAAMASGQPWGDASWVDTRDSIHEPAFIEYDEDGVEVSASSDFVRDDWSLFYGPDTPAPVSEQFAPAVLPEELPDLNEWPEEFDLSTPYGPLLARSAATLGYIAALDAEARHLGADASPVDLTPWLLDFDHPDLHEGEGA